MPGNGINCLEIVKTFVSPSGPVRVLKALNFHAPPGKLTLLAGPSGCGKTTLLSIIAGLLSTTSGTVNIFGRELTSMPQRELLKYRLNHVGFVFQQFNLIMGLNALENVCLPLVAAGKKWPEATGRAMDLLDRLGLDGHVHKLPRQLSGGQQQRVAIARALVNSPDIMLCDEPTASLDSRSGREVMTLLRELAVSPSRATVIVTHDPRIYSYADRIVHMEDGMVEKIEACEPQP
ncbi:MAG: ABC transporter ATP-binding protein [Victivallaceae bacterium]|nr:ABC transporter ATP-binding protein [Victivallaceae bacterium]